MSYLDCCCKKKPGSYTHGSRHVVSRRYSAGWNTWASNPRYRREITGIQWELYGKFYESIVDGVGLQWEFAHVYTTYHHMVMQIYGEIYIESLNTINEIAFCRSETLPKGVSPPSSTSDRYKKKVYIRGPQARSLSFHMPTAAWVIKCPHWTSNIRYMVYNGYYKVMSNIPKMEQLSTPVQDRTRTQPTMGQTVWKNTTSNSAYRWVCLRMGCL